MTRTLSFVLLTLMLASSVSAATMHKFVAGIVPEGENSLVVVGDGNFSLSDTPNPAPNDFQYEAVDPFDVKVTASDGAGGSQDVTFSLLRASTTEGRFNLIFSNPDHANLLLWLDVDGLTKGAPVPTGTIDDLDGIVRWNAPSLEPVSLSSPMLAGSLQGGQVAVPEPTGMFTMLLGLAGLARGIRQTF